MFLRNSVIEKAQLLEMAVLFFDMFVSYVETHHEKDYSEYPPYRNGDRSTGSVRDL